MFSSVIYDLSVKVHMTSVGTLNVCNLWILLRKIVFMDFLAVKVDGSEVKSGICEEVFM